ncbi:UNVERIFIED_CONTAM: hypothetical protein O8I53_11540 [Campylobacter lari]
MAVAFDYTHLISLKFDREITLVKTSKKTGITDFSKVKKFDMTERFGGYDSINNFQFINKENKIKLINFLKDYKNNKRKYISFDEDIYLTATTFYNFKDIVIKANTPFRFSFRKVKRLDFETSLAQAINEFENAV